MKTKLRRFFFPGLVVLCAAIATVFVFHASAQQKTKGKSMSDIRLMTLDPGHFHAALVQKETLSGVSPQVHVYAPLGFDLIEHLKRIAGYNTRKENPTALGTGSPHRRRFSRADAARETGQRGGDRRAESRQD